MRDKLAEVESVITKITQDNIKYKNQIDEIQLNHERQVDALILEIINILDAFDKACAIVEEKGYCANDDAVKAVKRMKQPQKVAMSILSKYNVTQIDMQGQIIKDDYCTVADTEPDPSKEDGYVISVVKNGYLRGERLIRRAEVVIVRN